jgi:CRISPR type III-A-associated protein Csm2
MAETPEEQQQEPRAPEGGGVEAGDREPRGVEGGATEARTPEARPPEGGGAKAGVAPARAHEGSGGKPGGGGQGGGREGRAREGGGREAGGREGHSREGGNREGRGREGRGPQFGGREGGRGDDRRGGDRARFFDGQPDIDLDKLISDPLYLDNQAHGVVSRMRDMDSGTKSQLRRLYNAVRRAVRAPENERQQQFVMLRARLAYTIARHSLRSLDSLEKLLLQVTRKNEARGYERFRDLFEAIVAYNE